jgi:hypothetical protein
MSTSTSVNAKLYSYLEGYETCCFTGSSCREVTDSIRQLIIDEFRINFPDSVLPMDNINKMLSNVDKFFIRYYDRMKNIKNTEKVKTLADYSKEDKNTLDSLLSQLMGTDYCPLEAVAYMAISRKGDYMDICEKCPWYTYHKFCMIYLNENSEEAIVQKVQFRVAEYKYLALALLQTANILACHLNINIRDFSKYYTIFTNILTCSHIFELMNPSGNAREEYLSSALSLLTAQPLDYNSFYYKYYDSLLTSVFRDVIIGNKPYAKEMHDAIFSSSSFLHKSFDADRDYYYSMKGTGQSGFTGEHYSLQSSAFEVDIHKNDPRVKAFDSYIHYESKYMELPNPEDNPKICIKTIGINNPGKFKPRIIHIADNPLQDRCNWVHRRLMAVLNNLPSDCTRNQDNGRSFLQDLTRQWYFQYPNEEKIGIYCTDFSNATDTLDQRFSHRILEFVFHSSEVADFWDYVSQLDKEFYHVKGHESYHQLTGQPQGLLGSFAAFSLGHHFLFLMDMKENGMTQIKASDYYRVLGDDAVYNTVKAEKDFIKDILPHDRMGIERTSLEMSHFQKCESFAGFLINFDKSESVHYWSNEAKLDFAKVTYRNGKLFSPIPFRLAMRYSHSFDDKLATCIWRADRDDQLANKLMDYLISTLPDNKQEDYRNIIRCGELPFLDKFYDHRDYPSDYINRVRYALSVSMLNTGLAFTITGDSNRSNLSYDQYDQALSTIFTSQQRLRLENIDPNHKVMLLFYKNADIIQTLHEIYGETEFDDRFLCMCLASFMGDQWEDILWMIYDIASFQRQLDSAKANPNINYSDLKENFPVMRSYRDIKKDLMVISNKFITRGITKKPGESSYLFRKVFNILNSLHQQLDRSFDESITD